MGNIKRCQVPTQSPLSAMISQDLYRRGCRFCRSSDHLFLSSGHQANFLNDHLVNCPSRT